MKTLLLMTSLLITSASTFAADQVMRVGDASMDIKTGEIIYCAGRDEVVNVKTCECGYYFDGRKQSFGRILFEDNGSSDKALELCQRKANNSTQEMLMEARNCKGLGAL